VRLRRLIKYSAVIAFGAACYSALAGDTFWTLVYTIEMLTGIWAYYDIEDDTKREA